MIELEKHGAGMGASAAVYVAAVLLLLPFLGVRGFESSAEGRPAVVARDILATGRICPPYLQGAPYLNKPPLYHALVAVSFGVFGRSDEFTARLPSVLLGAAVLLAVFVSARRRHGAGFGLVAAAALLGGLRFFTNARTSEIEILVALTSVLAYGAVEALFERRGRRTTACLLLALACGLGSVAKGPNVAPLFPLFLILGNAFVRRDGRAALLPIAAVILGTAVGALGYWGPLVADGWWPELRERLELKNNRHTHGAFYYLLAYPSGLLPAALLLPLVWVSRRALAATDKARLLAFAFALVVFSIPRSKQSHYLLPLDPLVALVLAEALRLAWRAGRRWFVDALLALTVLGALGAQAAAMRVRGIDLSILRAWWPALPPVALGLIGAVLWRRFRGGREAPAAFSFVVLASWSALVYFDAGRGLVQNVERSPRQAMRAFRVHAAGGPLATTDQATSVLFYLDRPDLGLLGAGPPAIEFLRRNDDGFVVVEHASDDPEAEVWRASLPIAASWRSPGGRQGWDLLGPGRDLLPETRPSK